MAKKVKIDLVGSADGLQASLKKAGASIKDFASDSTKTLNGVSPKGFMDKLAASAKSMSKERRASGEMALERMLGSPEGMARAGMQAMGLGMGGVVAEGTGRLFAGATDMISKMVVGGDDTGKLVKEMAEGLPMIGPFVKGWENIIGLINGSTAAEAAFNKELEHQKILGEMIEHTAKDRYAARIASTENPHDRELLQIEHERNEKMKGVDKRPEMSLGWMANFSYNVASGLGMKDTASDIISEEQKKFTKTHTNDLKLIDQQKQAINDEAAAKKAEADAQESRRYESSMLTMERSIAASRLDIWRTGAHDATTIWQATLAGIDQKTANEIADIDNRLKNDKSLTEPERQRLQEVKTAISSQGQVQAAQASNEYWRGVHQDRRNVEGSLLGDASSMISQLQALPGADTPEAQRMQKLLAATQFNNSMNGQLDSILTNDKASKNQKIAAGEAKSELAHLTETLTSEQALNMQPYQPLRFAGAEDVTGSRYSGAAEVAMDKDAENYAKTQTDYQKTMVDLLTKIAALFPKATSMTDPTPVFGPQP